VRVAPMDLRIRELLHENLLSEMAACLAHLARGDLSTNQPSEINDGIFVLTRPETSRSCLL
jgi:hypothetical protein